ncbi:SDR family oxidoreductase [Pararhodospirillum oryzae]|uniref:NAD(P)-dependent oxidoreductase n=1 Tax=Pararhodospirillum oryzae TaxID=478448 RepID=A0A512H6N8_9PROT|nr:SDR family oxidoreductase [Pararhodospirillum oryzae]GEO81107.1 NAD(P)-dependent oxidoreductase [Pararhodospirillum oryzae]
MADTPGYLLCFGLGYAATRLARGLLRDGWRVLGTARTPSRCEALQDAIPGLAMVPFDGVTPLDPAAFAGVTHVLSSIPPDADGDPVLRQHDHDLATAPLSWIGYFSTTGVYGDSGGGWVDEGTPVRPTQERTRWRVAAEEAWFGLWRDHDAPVHVLRLGGIYGPGRSVFDQIRAGTARRIGRPGHVFSRIHVDDIGLVVAASMHDPDPGAIYNLCDDEPAEPAEVLDYACALMGRPPFPNEPFERVAPTLSPMALSFWADHRRVQNERLWDDLRLRLLYPTFRQGLEAIRREEQGLVPPGPPPRRKPGCHDDP